MASRRRTLPIQVRMRQVLVPPGRRAPDTLEHFRARVRQFAADYNQYWLLERHGYRTPAQARQRLIDHAAVA